MRTVGELASLTGVTVRTLHHYDEIGLLRASERSESGYRLYNRDDLERLQEILIWRQLGFRLDEIQALLADPAHDRPAALRRQRALVEQELGRLEATARALDAALAAYEAGTQPEEDTMFQDFDPMQYEDETRERWGDTEAYQEAARRTAAYGDAEWSEVRAEADELVREFAALMAAGEPTDGDAAQAAAERHREHISRWFYPCGPEMHRNLGEMYVADPRFRATYDQIAPGLAAYVRDAIFAGADGEPREPELSR
jgi:DNA-binding transcriptional MerR regulator